YVLIECYTRSRSYFVFFFHPPPPPEIYTLSLHDALPILRLDQAAPDRVADELDPVAHAELAHRVRPVVLDRLLGEVEELGDLLGDRKSTRLNSSHSQISYAVFCLKKKKTKNTAET